MMQKIQFALFFPAFFLLYIAARMGNRILGFAGVLVLLSAAVLVFFVKKKR